MKKIAFIIFFSQLSYATEVKDFNRALIEGVKKDIEADNDDAFKKKVPMRGPASVEAAHPSGVPKDEKRIEKMNIKQIGPSKW